MGSAAFFVLTFAGAWTAWLAPAALGLPRERGVFVIGGPLFLLGVFAPSLVAIALTARSGGRAGVARLLAPIGRWQVPGRYYLFAVVSYAATKLAAALLVRVVTGAWPRFGDTPVLLMLAAIPTSTLVQAGEEVGWRGYALPRLADRMGPGAASVLLGIVWASWHLPLFFLPGSDTAGQSFPLYLLQVTALSVAMAWLYFRTGGSLLLTMLMHASVNNTIDLVPSAVAGASDALSWQGGATAWAAVVVGWLGAALLLGDLRRRREN